MEVTLGTILAGLIPTVAVLVVGYLLKRRSEGIDRRMDRFEVKLEDVANKVDEKNAAIMEKVDRHTQTLHKRVSDNDNKVVRMDERLNAHLKYEHGE